MCQRCHLEEVFVRRDDPIRVATISPTSATLLLWTAPRAYHRKQHPPKRLQMSMRKSRWQKAACTTCHSPHTKSAFRAVGGLRELARLNPMRRPGQSWCRSELRRHPQRIRAQCPKCTRAVRSPDRPTAQGHRPGTVGKPCRGSEAAVVVRYNADGNGPPRRRG